MIQRGLEFGNAPDYEILAGDCRDVMAAMDGESVDSIVSDPPYGLSAAKNSGKSSCGGFMGKKWDHGVPGVEFWTEALRVAKPGAHLLAFGGTRTYHRLACAIEDAGWEIRDCVMWVYGSGFPKSLDVGRAIDKRGGATTGFKEFRDAVKDAMKRNGVSRTTLNAALGNHMLSHYLTAGSQPAVPNAKDYRIIRDTVGLGRDWDHLFMDEAEREVVGQRTTGIGTGGGSTPIMRDGSRNITAPATDAAKQWAGWGTALKPAHEPIIVARKPLCGTVAENVLTHGTGGINVDGCRVAGPSGRWPANVIHDGSDEVVGLFPNDAARFFYVPKASKKDREGSTHPTMKPTDLMRYLCRLVAPPGGIVLDQFMGSGSTGKAAMLEGFRFIGIEREAEYVEIARARIGAV